MFYFIGFFAAGREFEGAYVNHKYTETEEKELLKYMPIPFAFFCTKCVKKRIIAINTLNSAFLTSFKSVWNLCKMMRYYYIIFTVKSIATATLTFS